MPGSKPQAAPIVAALPTYLVPPVLFTGLLVTLWVQKCILMILFQNKIIYMPSLPPNSRYETIADYARECRGVGWEEQSIRSLDGTQISLCVGRILEKDHVPDSAEPKKHIVIVYFQGNGSSTPPRLPLLSRVLRTLHNDCNPSSCTYTIIALSYRGYWTSRGRPSQSGIELDALATLSWVQQTYAPSLAGDMRIILWGQSIGAGVAATALAKHFSALPPPSNLDDPQDQQRLPIAALILETPFLSIRKMLAALYPEKWVPYQYLWPFLRNWWDSEAALRKLAAHGGVRRGVKVLMLEAEMDEVVPRDQGEELWRVAGEAGLDVRRVVVGRALHHEASTKGEGQRALVGLLKEVGR
ncbi:alpha/beta-hydrolase [Saccharata proteae CBS 121410]|uniref:Alpha/beta-hydrolase n=1 Tax=Saccharata proteae CBS 121410 TaxID=1314787 RepID=A0A9P4LSE8_9PEZI|nr:alpha/beta-hydrolase [Saccharata proteae CBS 121410]